MLTQRGTDTPGGSSQPGGSPSQVELEAYLATPPLPDGMDVLQWWGENEDRFPNVARMAAQYLACPASSATVERFFSLAGRLLDKRSAAMKESTLEDRMWAKLNRGRRVQFAK